MNDFDRLLDPRQHVAIRVLYRRWCRSNQLQASARRSAETDFRARWRLALFADPCSYCGGAVETLDHVEPASKGGTWHWTNLTGACAACNVEKAATPLILFLLRRAQARERAAELRAVNERSAPRRFGLFAERLAAAVGIA